MSMIRFWAPFNVSRCDRRLPSTLFPVGGGGLFDLNLMKAFSIINKQYCGLYFNIIFSI